MRLRQYLIFIDSTVKYYLSFGADSGLSKS